MADRPDYEAMWQDALAAKRIAAGAADRFRDVLSECLGHAENPGDDVLIAELRKHFGKAGPEPRRWRDFLTGALATLDQIHAMPDPLTTTPGPRVHNHSPYRPVCAERTVDGQLRGACLNDDGSDR